MASRDVDTSLFYYRQEAPRTDVSVPALGKSWSNIVEMKFPMKMKEYYKRYPVKIVDARTHLPGGKEAWDIDDHGFCFVKPPNPVSDFQDYGLVKRDYGPQVAEVCRLACGAKKAFWMSHMRRAEIGDAPGARKNMNEGYATGAGHSDYGPEFEEQFRTVLHRRYGMPEEEARTCGLVLVNMWVPVERPAYKDPLCLLDASSIDMEKETVAWKLANDIDNGYKVAYKEGGLSSKEALERVPVAAQDAPALAPTYGPTHRWVYLPDMAEDEAVVFKQYDFRNKVPGMGAKATFHCSFPDQFHNNWKDCPGRRSLECRVILTYDPETPAAKL